MGRTILIPKTIGNRKRDCAWGCARRINTTWKNLQIEKHKSGRRLFHSPDWFVLSDLQIFSGGVFPPSTTSCTISFSISNSFWYYRKRGSASYIVREVLLVRERERERERERDGSDVTIVVLKLSMSLHLPLPKIRTWRWVYTFPCRKFAPFDSPFTLPSSPFLNGHHCGALKFAMSSHFPLPKNFALFVNSDSLKWRDCSFHRKNESN